MSASLVFLADHPVSTIQAQVFEEIFVLSACSTLRSLTVRRLDGDEVCHSFCDQVAKVSRVDGNGDVPRCLKLWRRWEEESGGVELARPGRVSFVWTDYQMSKV